MYFRPKILTNEAMPISSVFTIFLHSAYVLLGEVKTSAVSEKRSPFYEIQWPTWPVAIRDRIRRSFFGNGRGFYFPEQNIYEIMSYVLPPQDINQ
jgi:hypothetical protein